MAPRAVPSSGTPRDHTWRFLYSVQRMEQHCRKKRLVLLKPDADLVGHRTITTWAMVHHSSLCLLVPEAGFVV